MLGTEGRLRGRLARLDMKAKVSSFVEGHGQRWWQGQAQAQGPGVHPQLASVLFQKILRLWWLLGAIWIFRVWVHNKFFSESFSWVTNKVEFDSCNIRLCI